MESIGAHFFSAVKFANDLVETNVGKFSNGLGWLLIVVFNINKVLNIYLKFIS